MAIFTRDYPIPVRTPLGAWLLGALLGSAFLLRAAYGLFLPNALLIPDAGSFNLIAWSVATEGQYSIDGHPTAVRPPSYVLFLAAIYKVAGYHFRAARLAQAVMGLGLVLLLMGIARELGWSPRTVWAVGWMAAFYPFFIYYDAQLIADAYLTFWHTAALFAAILWGRQLSSNPRAIGTGLAFAVLCLIKSIYVPLYALILALEAYKSISSKQEPFPWKAWLAAGVAFLIPLLLWAWRNERVLGQFLLDSHGGRTSVETIVLHDHVKDGSFPEFWKTSAIRQAVEALPEQQQDAAYFRVTKNFIRENPGLYAKQSLVRLKDFWRFYPRQDIQFRESKSLITWLSLLTEPVLILLGFFALALSWRQWRTLYPFYATILLTTAVYALTTGQMRYRLPLMPILILFTAYGLFSTQHPSPDH